MAKLQHTMTKKEVKQLHAGVDVCTCCTEPKSDSLIDYVFMRKMYETHGVEGVTPICVDCSNICTEYEDVEIKRNKLE